MTQLLDGIGIQKGSFYATFGSKRDVFIAALCHDTETWTDQFADAAPPALLLHADARACRPVPRRGRRLLMLFWPTRPSRWGRTARTSRNSAAAP